MNDAAITGDSFRIRRDQTTSGVRALLFRLLREAFTPAQEKSPI